MLNNGKIHDSADLFIYYIVKIYKKEIKKKNKYSFLI